MAILTLEVKKPVKRCVACPGCNAVRSSARCDYHCSKWFELRVKELSYASRRIKIPNYA